MDSLFNFFAGVVVFGVVLCFTYPVFLTISIYANGGSR